MTVIHQNTFYYSDVMCLLLVIIARYIAQTHVDHYLLIFNIFIIHEKPYSPTSCVCRLLLNILDETIDLFCSYNL